MAGEIRWLSITRRLAYTGFAEHVYLAILPDEEGGYLPVVAINYPDEMLPRMLEILAEMEEKGISPRVFQRDRGDIIDFLVLLSVKDASLELLGEMEATLSEMDVSPYESLEICIFEVMSFPPEVARNFLRFFEAKGFYHLRILEFLDADQSRVFWEARLTSIETDLAKLSQ